MDFLFGLTSGDVTYDIETFPNCFTCCAKHTETNRMWQFEISERRNDAPVFRLFLNTLSDLQCRLVGYNNIGFDYPVIHEIYKNRFVTVEQIYQKAMSIINAHPSAKFAHIVWDNDHIVQQLDLYKIHHFDNQARATSLKVLEFNMRMDNIEDLPFDVGTILNNEQVQTLIEYNWHDVEATTDFYFHTIEQIKFRENLTQKYNRNFMNHNDTKIGKDFFIMRLEEEGIDCYKREGGRRVPRQTPRPQIQLKDAILDYIKFEHPEFQRILNWFKQQTITETKGVFKNVHCVIDGFQYDFGTGGIHGSVESQVVESDQDYIIEDWDVASYYPNLAIANRLYPAHLGQEFCDIYEDVYQQRKQHKKGTVENAMLKLALNGVYGDSNNQYSPFYDPLYTMTITLGGQLSLCMLAEQLLKVPQLQMVQINTDGLSIKYPRPWKEHVHHVCKWWENYTNLALEQVEYKRMFIRDVNNYIGEYTNGDLKRKGAYEYKLGWHQNHSALVVPKAAEAALVHGVDVRTFIEDALLDDHMDFMLRAKVPRSSYLEWGGERVANIVRYYVSTDGDMLEKVMPPKGPIGHYKRANKLTDDYYNRVLEEVGPGVWDERIHTKNKSMYEGESRTGINTGYTVMLCSDMHDFDITVVNIDWYVNEAYKLINPLIR